MFQSYEIEPILEKYKPFLHCTDVIKIFCLKSAHERAHEHKR